MTWIQDNNSPYLTFDSKAATSNTLQGDFELIFERIVKDRIIAKPQLLLFIDASNGHVFVYGYDMKTKETFDEPGIWIELQSLWQECDNANDFDDIVEETLNKALKTPIGELMKQQYAVFYQAEVGDVKESK